MWFVVRRVTVGLMAVALLVAVPDVARVEGMAAAGAAIVEEPWGARQTLARSWVFRVATDGEYVPFFPPGDPGPATRREARVVAFVMSERGVDVFSWSGAEWVLTQQVTPPDSPGLGGFDWAFDVHGDVMAVRQSRSSERTSSSVQVFERRDDLWEHATELKDLEAFSIAVWGDVIAVAGVDHSDAAHGHGVYIFERSGGEWQRTAEILLTGGGCYPNSVDVWKNRLVVGIYHSFDPCDGWPPATYLYRRVAGSWVEEHRLPATRGDAMFPKSVSIWGNTVVVGDAIQNSDPPTERLPKVRIFEWDGERWSRTQVIKRLRHAFGGSVALHRNTLVIGDTDQGGAWVYTRVDGRFRHARHLSNGGRSVAVWGPVVLNAGPGLFNEHEGRVDAYRLTQCQGFVPTIVGTFDDDTLTGTAHADVILALAGNDRVDAGDGPDIVCGRAGADRLIGRQGDDTMMGGRGHDLLRGGFGNDFLRGGQGDDTIYGGPGDDFLLANEADVTPNGDELYGGAGYDYCVFADVNIDCEVIIHDPDLPRSNSQARQKPNGPVVGPSENAAGPR